jgi:hypothetical protein
LGIRTIIPCFSNQMTSHKNKLISAHVWTSYCT